MEISHCNHCGNTFSTLPVFGTGLCTRCNQTISNHEHEIWEQDLFDDDPISEETFSHITFHTQIGSRFNSL